MDRRPRQGRAVVPEGDADDQCADDEDLGEARLGPLSGAPSSSLSPGAEWILLLGIAIAPRAAINEDLSP